MFNKRHYNFIAEEIKNAREAANELYAQGGAGIAKDVLDSLTWSLAAHFAADNSKFDADKFFNATVEGVKRHATKQ